MCCHIPSQRSVKLYQSILQPNAQEYSGLQGSLYQSTWSPVCCGYHARISLTQELVLSFDYLLKTLTISVRYLTPRQNKDPSDMFTCTLIYQTQVISIIEVHTAKEFNPTAILHLLHSSQHIGCQQLGVVCCMGCCAAAAASWHLQPVCYFRGIQGSLGFLFFAWREGKDAMITWKQISIFFPSQIKSSRDVKGLFLGISFVSSQVSMQLVGKLSKGGE